MNVAAQVWSVWPSMTANEHAKLTTGETQRLGRNALVIGGTGFVGRYVCNTLALRHMKVFSLSRRGAELEVVPDFALNVLDLVQWVQADVSQPETWSELAPLLRDISEVYICLPRTMEGANLAGTCIHQLRRYCSATRHVSLLSRAKFWKGNCGGDSDTPREWQRVEGILEQEFPEEHKIIQPGELYSYMESEGCGNYYGARKSRYLRNWYKISLYDKKSYCNPMELHRGATSPGHREMSITKWEETRWSAYCIPPIHVSQCVHAMIAPDLTDMEGGVVRKFNIFACIMLNQYKPAAIGPDYSPFTPVVWDDIYRNKTAMTT